jgi:D-aminopeptidase
MAEAEGARLRARAWGIRIGSQGPGAGNAITDVPGVLVGAVDLVEGSGPLEPGRGPVRTGVSAVWPASGNLVERKVPAAVHVIHGFSKCCGLVQVEELGWIETPILITGTLNVGRCADALIEYLFFKRGWGFHTLNPVVMECNDRYLNDIAGRHVRREHVFAALDSAAAGVREGNAGAGVGMKCYSFKGGIGTSSRRLDIQGSPFAVGCLVCTNMGSLADLRIDGVRVGESLRGGSDPGAAADRAGGSIIILIATDAPLSGRQLKQVARRATHGLARTGTCSDSGSGEIVLAWSTGYRIEDPGDQPCVVSRRLHDGRLDPFFRAAADCTEEAILNALWMAETMTGRDGHRLERLPAGKVRAILERAGYRFHAQG